MRAVQVVFHADAQRRSAEALLAAWPTLTASAASVARAGVETHVLVAAHERRSLMRDDVSFEFVDDPRAAPIQLGFGARVPRRPSRLLDRIEALRPDVVHVHGLNYPLAIRQLTDALPKVPVMVQDHGSPAPTGWKRPAQRWAYRSVAGVAFTARGQADPFFASSTLNDSVRVFEILGGSSTFTPGDRDVARRATGLSGDPCILWTGRLDANKDPCTMLRAFELAAQRLRDARLWCCFGSAPMLDVVQRQIAASPLLRERVTLLGARPHDAMEQCFRAADLYVQTSHREASGFSLLEALSCGVVPIVTDIPATRRIVGDAGSLVPVGDSSAMAEAIVEWAERDRVSMRAMARTRFESALTFDVIGREVRSAYESLVRSR
jgi:glycosyltransferase involved in cell wall biosynthesis